jgi:hypothetical protein
MDAISTALLVRCARIGDQHLVGCARRIRYRGRCSRAHPTQRTRPLRRLQSPNATTAHFPYEENETHALEGLRQELDTMLPRVRQVMRKRGTSIRLA